MAKTIVERTTQVFIEQSAADALFAHLFSGGDEHGAVLCAGIVETSRVRRLVVRRVVLARDGIDYVPGKRGYRALAPQFIYEQLHYCRERGLCYLAVHNHGGSDYVDFSEVDLESHRRGYPTLLQLSHGLPVGALVFAQRAARGVLWLSKDCQENIAEVRIVGTRTTRLFAAAKQPTNMGVNEVYSRQVLMFGELGQQELSNATLGIIGAGGAGSILNELAAHLGVGHIKIVDPDRLEPSNRSRVVGSRPGDCAAKKKGRLKVAIAARTARKANPEIDYLAIPENFSLEKVAKEFRDCDFLLLAADSHQARLVFNSLVYQYLIPGIQVGSKVSANANGHLTSAFSVIRWVTPQGGCLLCNGFIDSQRLAMEAKSELARAEQAYGTHQPNPSVIGMNAIVAAHAINDFMMGYLGLFASNPNAMYRRFDHLSHLGFFDKPRRDADCTECGILDGSRYGMGDRVRLPTFARNQEGGPVNVSRISTLGASLRRAVLWLWRGVFRASPRASHR